ESSKIWACRRVPGRENARRPAPIESLAGLFRPCVREFPKSGTARKEEAFMALTINNLSKTYSNGVRRLKKRLLTNRNNMFGLLGPNGAGKSSLMRTVATLQDPDAGTITLDGIDVLAQKNEIRKRLGYLPQEFGVYPKLSAIDMLQHLAVLKGVTSAGE